MNSCFQMKQKHLISIFLEKLKKQFPVNLTPIHTSRTTNLISIYFYTIVKQPTYSRLKAKCWHYLLYSDVINFFTTRNYHLILKEKTIISSEQLDELYQNFLQRRGV